MICFAVPVIDFLFIQEESYDMVIRKDDFLKKPYQKMIEIIQTLVGNMT